MRRANRDAEPETRVGICCGCQVWSALVFKVPGVYRYRCAACFRRETGKDHPDCRRVFACRPVMRPDAGGPLYGAVDQFGIEFGDTPTYDGARVAKRCEELNSQQLYPVSHPQGLIPCFCRVGCCGNDRGEQLLPGYYCRESTVHN